MKTISALFDAALGVLLGSAFGVLLGAALGALAFFTAIPAPQPQISAPPTVAGSSYATWQTGYLTEIGVR